MKNIKILFIGTLFFIGVMGCRKDYKAPDELIIAAWITNIPPNTAYTKNAGEFISFTDLSLGALTHEWTIENGNYFLKKGFNPKDSLLPQANIEAGIKSAEVNINVLFLKAGINKVTLRNTFDRKVTYPGTVPIEAKLENGVWVIEYTWVINIYGPLLPAFKVLNKSGAEVINVAKDKMISLSDSASWPVVNVEAGDSLTFVDLTTDDRPSGRRWNIAEGKPTASTDSVAKIAFFKLGQSLAGTFTSLRTLPVGNTPKIIPLKINVTPSSRPFVFAGNLVEAKDETISFRVSGEVTPFTGKEANFKVLVINSESGFDSDIPVQTARVSATDATKIELKLSAPIYNSDVITVNFKSAGAGIQSVDTRALVDFGPQTVTAFFDSNLLPAYFAGFEDYNSNWRKAFAEGFFAGNSNGSDTDPIYARTTDKFVSAPASMSYTATAGVVQAVLQGSDFDNLTLPAGTYKLSIKVYLDPANTMSKFLTLVQDPFTTISWDVSAIARGQWVTLSQNVTFSTPPGKRYDIRVNTGAENPNAGTGLQKMYLDDMSFVTIEKRL